MERNPFTSTVATQTPHDCIRIILSVNQHSIYGAVADLCEELSIDSGSAGQLVAHENLDSMVTRTEGLIAHSNDQTNVVQRQLFVECEQKCAALPEQEKLIKLCSNAGLSTPIEKGHLFATFDDGVLVDDMKVTCREYTLPRSYESSRITGWIRGNTKIGPVLEVAVTHHQGRYGMEIMMQSLLGDETCSRVMILNGINKNVTEMTEETQDDHIRLQWRKYRETCC